MRIATAQGSERIAIAVAGKEVELATASARDVMLKIAEAIRRSHPDFT